MIWYDLFDGICLILSFQHEKLSMQGGPHYANRSQHEAYMGLPKARFKGCVLPPLAGRRVQATMLSKSSKLVESMRWRSTIVVVECVGETPHRVLPENAKFKDDEKRVNFTQNSRFITRRMTSLIH